MSDESFCLYTILAALGGIPTSISQPQVRTRAQALEHFHKGLGKRPLESDNSDRNPTEPLERLLERLVVVVFFCVGNLSSPSSAHSLCSSQLRIYDITPVLEHWYSTMLNPMHGVLACAGTLINTLNIHTVLSRVIVKLDGARSLK